MYSSLNSYMNIIQNLLFKYIKSEDVHKFVFAQIYLHPRFLY